MQDRILQLIIAIVLVLPIIWFATPKVLNSVSGGSDTKTPETDGPAIVSARKPGVEESRKEVPAFIPEPIETKGPKPTRASASGPVTTPAWLLDSTNAYAGPGLNQEIVMQLRAGDQVKWVERRDGWEKVILSSRGEVWIPGNHLTFRRPPEARDADPQEAVETCKAFFADLAKGDLSQAYQKLGEGRRQQIDYMEFAEAYVDFQGVEMRVERIEILSPRSVKVFLQLNTGGYSGGGYRGYQILEEESGRWFVTGGVLEAR